MGRGRVRQPLVKVVDLEGNDSDLLERLVKVEKETVTVQGMREVLLTHNERLTDLLTEFRVLSERFRSFDERVQRIESMFPAPIERKPLRTKIYIVQEDDTLAKIAKKVLGVAGRYVEIAALNELSGQTELKPGQELKLPTD